LPKDIYTLELEDASEMPWVCYWCIRVAKKRSIEKKLHLITLKQLVLFKKPYLFMAATITDFTPEYPQMASLKKHIEW